MFVIVKHHKNVISRGFISNCIQCSSFLTINIKSKTLKIKYNYFIINAIKEFRRVKVYADNTWSRNADP